MTAVAAVLARTGWATVEAEGRLLVPVTVRGLSHFLALHSPAPTEKPAIGATPVATASTFLDTDASVTATAATFATSAAATLRPRLRLRPRLPLLLLLLLLLL